MTDDDIRNWLEAHPDVFIEHQDWLDLINLPQESDIPSLMQAQVERLRKDKRTLTGQLHALKAIAEDNENLTRRLHRLTLQLLTESGNSDILRVLQDRLREDFDIDAVRFHRRVGNGDASASQWPGWAERALQLGKIECGRLTREKIDFLFADSADSIASVALIPLPDSGLLAIGSNERERFQPGIGTLFLELLGQTVHARLDEQHHGERKSA